MANLAKHDQQQRTVEVDRMALIDTLKANRAAHVRDYIEAMAGYKATLLAKIDDAFSAAKQKLADRHTQIRAKVTNFTVKDIAKQRDCFSLLDSMQVEMRVPKSYADEYNAAIDMATWDVRPVLELSHAEFACFVLNKWDWSHNFDEVTRLYMSGK